MFLLGILFPWKKWRRVLGDYQMWFFAIEQQTRLVFEVSSSSFEDSLNAWQLWNMSLIHNLLESVSHVTLVPCNMGLSSSTLVNLLEFLLQVMACECKLCSCKTTTMALNDSIQEHGWSRSHLYIEVLFVYFWGFASSGGITWLWNLGEVWGNQNFHLIKSPLISYYFIPKHL